MLEVLNKAACFFIMSITGFYVIKIITQSEVKLLNIKTLACLSIMVITQMSLYKVQYTMAYTLTIFLLNIIIYKTIFKLPIENAVISCSIFTITLFFADLVSSMLVNTFSSARTMRDISGLSILANMLTGLASIIISDIELVKNQTQSFYKNCSEKKVIPNVLFFLLVIVDLSCIAYKLFSKNTNNIRYSNIAIVMSALAIITYIFIRNKNNYKQLSDEYDSLFNYVQNFEDWIEKEQLNRHEYKNQLAVLRCLSKEKKVKDKIDDILDDSINIEGRIINQLKNLPKGGLKGLMYYKAAIAQKNKINLEADISLENKTILLDLTQTQVKVLCKLIGIYFDNAIEAATETRKKTILLEVYELNNKVTVVISNTFKKVKNLDRRNERGFTTKGEGHGNGLYFANNLISKNKWITSKQEIIDNYYIETLTIKKLDY